MMGHYFDFLIYINHHVRPVVLSENFVSLLWYMLASSLDPVLDGLVVTLLLAVYSEYATFSIERTSFHKMLSQENIEKRTWKSWVWTCLTMPVLQLRYVLSALLFNGSTPSINSRISMPHIFQKMRGPDLENLRYYIELPYIQGGGAHMQSFMRESIRCLKDVMPTPLDEDDPILGLIADLACPLNELADEFEEWRYFAWELKAMQIPRLIPSEKLSILMARIVDGMQQ
jgi:hypothetical protein